MRRIAIIITALFLSNISHAEDAGTFFEKDFAKNPLEQSKDRPVIQQPETEFTPVEKEDAPKESFDKKDFVTDSDIAPKSSDTPGRSLEWIGLIISTEDRSKLDSSLRKLSEIARAHDLKVGIVYFVGNSAISFQYQKLMAEFVARGSVIKFPSKPPKEYSVKRSPSWIIALNEGEVLLDGVLDPSQYLNNKGEFIGPTGTKVGDQLPAE